MKITFEIKVINNVPCNRGKRVTRPQLTTPSPKSLELPTAPRVFWPRQSRPNWWSGDPETPPPSSFATRETRSCCLAYNRNWKEKKRRIISDGWDMTIERDTDCRAIFAWTSWTSSIGFRYQVCRLDCIGDSNITIAWEE